jgi:hypothetical protein
VWIAAFADEADCNDHLRIWKALYAVTWSGAQMAAALKGRSELHPAGSRIERSLRALSKRPSHERCAQRNDAMLETLQIRARFPALTLCTRRVRREFRPGGLAVAHKPAAGEPSVGRGQLSNR